MLKVNMKFLLSLEYFECATHVVMFTGRYKFTVYQDCRLYMKFNHPEDAEYMART
jgi:hypothetical protein